MRFDIFLLVIAIAGTSATPGKFRVNNWCSCPTAVRRWASDPIQVPAGKIVDIDLALETDWAQGNGGGSVSWWRNSESASAYYWFFYWYEVPVNTLHYTLVNSFQYDPTQNSSFIANAFRVKSHPDGRCDNWWKAAGSRSNFTYGKQPPGADGHPTLGNYTDCVNPGDFWLDLCKGY